MPNSPTSNSASPAQGLAPDPATQSVDKIKTDAAALRTEAQNLAGSVAAEATEQAGHLADEAKAQAAAAVEKAKGLAGEQKDLLGDQIGGVADAMQRVARELEDKSVSSAPYARMIADNAERLASTIKNNDVDGLLNMAQDFGRRQPAAFVGVAAMLGFAASRFLLASGARASAATAAEQPAGTDVPNHTQTPSSFDSTYSNGGL